MERSILLIWWDKTATRNYQSTTIQNRQNQSNSETTKYNVQYIQWGLHLKKKKQTVFRTAFIIVVKKTTVIQYAEILTGSLSNRTELTATTELNHKCTKLLHSAGSTWPILRYRYGNDRNELEFWT